MVHSIFVLVKELGIGIYLICGFRSIFVKEGTVYIGKMVSLSVLKQLLGFQTGQVVIAVLER